MKYRRKPTAEQSAAAAEKRAKMRELAALVSAMPQEKRQAIADQAGIHTIEGRPLSPHNACFLMVQASGVSVVGGFQQWKKAGRTVRKGAKGLAIWIPTGSRDTDGADTAAPEAGEEKNIRPRFVMGYVFDITQTRAADEPEADDCPALAAPVLALPAAGESTAAHLYEEVA